MSIADTIKKVGGIKYPYQITELLEENEQLKARVSRLEKFIKYTYEQDQLGWEDMPHNDARELLNESPAQSLVSI